MNKVELILKEIERLKGKLIRGACASGITMETRCKDEAYDAISKFAKSLLEESNEKQPEYSFFEKIYHRGKKPHWNIGDTLAFYEFYTDIEGEHVIGKIADIELDEECDDWIYCFENGLREDEESLIAYETYKKN